MSEEKPPGDNRVNRNRPSLREAFTLVVRIWRHSRKTLKLAPDWHAEISIVDLKSSSTRYAVGAEHIVNAVTDSLEGRIGL